MVKPVVVAEAGINHNGSLIMAKTLVALARNFGADYVKFQKRNPDVCVPEDQKDIRKQTIFGPMSYIDYKHRIELGRSDYDKIDDYCRKLGIGWFASVWDVDSVRFMLKYNPPFFKIPSACVTDIDLLNAVAETSVPVIMSTGMSTLDEIKKAVEVLSGNLRFILHTTSSYPTPNEEMNMNKICSLNKMFGSFFKIGFSNHCIDIIYTIQAAIMDARMIEFHITLDRNMPGTDQYASIGPIGFDRIMKHLDNIDRGWGDGKLKIMKSEKSARVKLRRK